MLASLAFLFTTSCGGQQVAEEPEAPISDPVLEEEAEPEHVNPSVKRMVMMGYVYCITMGTSAGDCDITCTELEPGEGTACAISTSDFEALLVCVQDPYDALLCMEDLEWAVD